MFPHINLLSSNTQQDEEMEIRRMHELVEQTTQVLQQAARVHGSSACASEVLNSVCIRTYGWRIYIYMHM